MRQSLCGLFSFQDYLKESSCFHSIQTFLKYLLYHYSVLFPAFKYIHIHLHISLFHYLKNCPFISILYIILPCWFPITCKLFLSFHTFLLWPYTLQSSIPPVYSTVWCLGGLIILCICCSVNIVNIYYKIHLAFSKYFLPAPCTPVYRTSIYSWIVMFI